MAEKRMDGAVVLVKPIEPVAPASLDPSEPEPGPGEKRSVLEWATRAGHVAPQATDLAHTGSIHTGPDVRVVLAHAQGHGIGQHSAADVKITEPRLRGGLLVTRAEYEACVQGAYSIICGEPGYRAAEG